MKTTTFLEYIDYCNIIKETTQKDILDWKETIESYYETELDEFDILDNNEDYAIGSIINKTDLNSSILYFNKNNKWCPIGGYIDRILYINDNFKHKGLSIPLIINTGKIRGGTFVEPKYFTKEGMISHMSAHRNLVLSKNKTPEIDIILSNPKLISYYLNDYLYFINEDDDYFYAIKNKYFLKEKVIFFNKINKTDFSIIETNIESSLEDICDKYQISNERIKNIKEFSYLLCSENFMHM